MEGEIPDPLERKRRKQNHQERVQHRRENGDDTEDDDTVESKADMMDDFNMVSAAVASTKALLEETRQMIASIPSESP